ncbi:hypothetical protein JZ751_003318 [Albula glossodonta]|uniref:Sema domain-containing protein n=1 Tax=Albula glossodonta TaxID=121402 RepID=A0A8T2NED3_9TELE|nr:hypothetical protein JZ751_003318 [Albula glossodonta]
MWTLVPLFLLAHLGSGLTGSWRPSQPRLQFSHKELVQNGRLLTLPLPAGDLYALVPDEDSRRLYGAMKDQLLATSLDDITQGPRQLECANFLRVLEVYNHTHLYVCGTGAFNPRCAFIPTETFLKDSYRYCCLGTRHVIRTEQYDSTWLQDAQFVKVAPIAESDNPEDDKVYIFFTEHAQEAEGPAGKVIYSRVARVCKNDIGGQRSLVNKWSTFLKARMVCSVPGDDGLHTHFDQLQDIFILHGRDKTNPLIYGLFTTSSNVLNGSAVCVYRMQDVVRVFKGHFSHKEGPQYKWAEFTGRVPFPRPGTCPSRTYGSYRSTREYPDDVIFFSRTHPLMMEAVYPVGERPLLVRVGVQYKFTRLLVDRVEAVDGQYDVMFIGTDSLATLRRSLWSNSRSLREERGDSHKLHQVTSGEQLVVIDRGVLIRRAEPGHGGVYHCQLEEHGFSWTAVTVQLSVIGPGSAGAWPAAGLQQCQGRRRHRSKNRKRADGADGQSEKHRGHEGGGGGGGGGGGEGGGAGKGGGRKSRSKPPPPAQRAPRSI